MAEKIEHVHQWVKPEPTVKIKLERGMKGNYAWEISTEDADIDQAMTRLSKADHKLRDGYILAGTGE